MYALSLFTLGVVMTTASIELVNLIYKTYKSL